MTCWKCGSETRKGRWCVSCRRQVMIDVASRTAAAIHRDKGFVDPGGIAKEAVDLAVEVVKELERRQ